jgi:hypothetical protein
MSDTTANVTPVDRTPQTEEGTPCGGGSSFWPISLLAVSFLALLLWQLVIAYHQRQNMKLQLTQRQELVQQSQKVQEELKRLVDSVIKFSKYDADAKALLDKYNITPK